MAAYLTYHVKVQPWLNRIRVNNNCLESALLIMLGNIRHGIIHMPLMEILVTTVIEHGKDGLIDVAVG